MGVSAGTRFGPYEILAPLGAGGMGEVYRARDTRIGREVAVKILPEGFASDPDRLRRFEQEARAAGSLNHPNILVLHDVGTHEGTPYLVTELLEGETLRERLDHGSISPRKAIDIALQITRGLAAAHERGLVHRDLKPANLFVLRDGRVKILDFGLAKLTRPEPAEGGMTRPTATVDTDRSVVMGTAGYMAPEQVRGQPADHRADIFAFGAILYEMLAGRRAFQGETNAETMTAILREEPPDLARDGKPLPPALDRIVRHCLEKSPQERFQSASDIGFALEALSGLSDTGPRPALVTSSGMSWRRFILPALGAILLLALGALLGRTLAPRSMGTVQFKKLTFRRGVVHTARFSPDGHTVYYGAEWDGKDQMIFTCTADAPGEQTVAAPPQSFLVDVSPSNELAILVRYSGLSHGGGIGTLARMTPGGAPREILENVSEADWSPDGASLAVIHVVGSRYRVEYPIGTVLYEAPGWISHLRVAPDGKRVAFIDHPIVPDDRGAAAMVTAPGRVRVMTPLYASAQGLVWAKDGREIWYCAAPGGNARSLYCVPAKGGSPRMLAPLPMTGRIQDLSPNGDALLAADDMRTGVMARAPGETQERDLSWLDWTVAAALSGDGKTVLFDEEGDGAGDHYSACIRGTDGSPPIRLGEGAANDLSRDAKLALVERYWLNPPQLVLYPTGPGEPRVLPATGLPSVSRARLFPSGDRILVTGNEAGHAIRTYVLPIGGGPLRPLTPEGIVSAPDPISPDGKLVCAAVRRGDAWLYPVDGGSPVRVRGKRPDEVPYGWSADGKALYMGTPQGSGPRTMTRLDIATGNRTPWAIIRGPEDRAGVATNFVVIGRDDHTYAYMYGRVLSQLLLVHGLH